MRILLYQFSLLLIILISPDFSLAQCFNAKNLNPYVLNATRINLTDNGVNDGGSPDNCQYSNTIADWLRIVIPENALATQMTITMTDWDDCENANPFLSCTTDLTGELYAGSCSNLNLIDCIDLSGGLINSNNGPFTYNISNGTTYYFRLSEEQNQGGYGDFTFSLNSTALPAELTQFNGKPTKTGSKLQWETASEENVAWFIVEKSADAQEWAEYERLKAVGNSGELQQYELMDEKPFPISYYRLKIVDFDDYTEYSDVITVKSGSASSPINRIYPNPSSGIFTLQLNEVFNLNNQSQMMIRDALGQSILHQPLTMKNIGGQNFQIDLSSLPDGMYFLSLQDAQGEIYTEKIYKR